MTQVVSEDVHLQSGGADIELVANVAGLGRLIGQHLVGLFVSAQVGTGGKVFATLFTFILGLLMTLFVLFMLVLNLKLNVELLQLKQRNDGIQKTITDVF